MKQGTDVDISCTVSGLNALGVVRIFKSNKDKRYPISDNDQPKTPFVETGRYTANYEYDSTSKVGVVRLQLKGEARRVTALLTFYVIIIVLLLLLLSS